MTMDAFELHPVRDNGLGVMDGFRRHIKWTVSVRDRTPADGDLRNEMAAASSYDGQTAIIPDSFVESGDRGSTLPISPARLASRIIHERRHFEHYITNGNTLSYHERERQALKTERENLRILGLDKYQAFLNNLEIKEKINRDELFREDFKLKVFGTPKNINGPGHDLLDPNRLEVLRRRAAEIKARIQREDEDRREAAIRERAAAVQRDRDENDACRLLESFAISACAGNATDLDAARLSQFAASVGFRSCGLLAGSPGDCRLRLYEELRPRRSSIGAAWANDRGRALRAAESSYRLDSRPTIASGPSLCFACSLELRSIAERACRGERIMQSELDALSWYPTRHILPGVSRGDTCVDRLHAALADANAGSSPGQKPSVEWLNSLAPQPQPPPRPEPPRYDAWPEEERPRRWNDDGPRCEPGRYGITGCRQ